MDTYQIFSQSAQDIHNQHYTMKMNKDQEIAERRILDYFKGNLNLTWKTILREINKLDELSRNKYFEYLVNIEKDKIHEQYRKKLYQLFPAFERLKKANWILCTSLIFQTCVIIYLKWGENV